LKLNKKNKIGFFPLVLALDCEIEMVKLLMEYADQHHINLDLNNKFWKFFCPIYEAVSSNNYEQVKLLIEYANQHQIILNMNGLLYNHLVDAIEEKNIKMLKLLIEYANQHQINLNLNGFVFNPLLEATYENNIEIVKLLIEYANQRQIVLKFRGNAVGRNPMVDAIYNKNIEMIKLFIEYANQNQINLKYNKKEFKDNSEIMNLIQNYEKEKKNKKKRTKKEKKLIENENNNDDKLPKTPTLVIVTNDFYGEEYNHLDIVKNEFLIVTDWNYEDGWVYGHRKDKEEEKGIFPKVFIKIYKNENNVKSVLKKNPFYSEITPEYKIRFEEKIKQLRYLDEMNLSRYSNINIEINRNDLFNDAFYSIMNKSSQELKKKLTIKYIGEEGTDAGGLLRDFFYQLSKEIGNPDYSLFKYSHEDSYELEINPLSKIVEPDHLQYFRFIGRIIGLAIYNKQYLPISFTLLRYKKILNKPFEFSDLELLDPQLYQNLQQLKNNNGVESLYLNFTIDIDDCFGHHKTIELKPNGANINVTDYNKNEYIDLVIENKFKNSDDKEQLDALKQGFYEIIPQNINLLLDEIDLKFLISGINIIDVDDWENNTEYEGYQKNDITIILFWECVRKFSNEYRKKLLLFATGNSQVPVTGFKDLQGSGRIQHFKIKKMGTVNDLPISHTCFNRIDLPPYTSSTIMKQKLLLAISEGIGAFTIC